VLQAPDILDCKPVDGNSDVGMDKPDNGLAAAEDEGSLRASPVAAAADGGYKGWNKWLQESRKSCGDGQQEPDEPLEQEGGDDDGGRNATN
jgi:hypothetical protein